jgi:helicase MOV-10
MYNARSSHAAYKTVFLLMQVANWFDRKIAANPEQRAAVQNIVAGTSGRLPFIVWGPPGTGKTSTLVEAAAQVSHRVWLNVIWT